MHALVSITVAAIITNI